MTWFTNTQWTIVGHKWWFCIQIPRSLHLLYGHPLNIEFKLKQLTWFVPLEPNQIFLFYLIQYQMKIAYLFFCSLICHYVSRLAWCREKRILVRLFVRDFLSLGRMSLFEAVCVEWKTTENISAAYEQTRILFQWDKTFDSYCYLQEINCRTHFSFEGNKKCLCDIILSIVIIN
jgi:hypothetical protein